jgi:vacuolar-type H+-ATPase subunit H
MDEQDILQHLLKIEAQSLSLVTDAQAEADKRVTAAERGNRSRYEERYGAETAALDEYYQKELTVVKEDYNRQLEEYRQSLEAMPVDTAAFCKLIDACLEGDF